MIIQNLIDDSYFNSEEINKIKSTSNNEILKIFDIEIKLKNAIDNDEIEYTYLYRMDDSENLFIIWFYKRILKIDLSKVDLLSFNKRTFEVSNPSLLFSKKVNVTPTIEVTEITYDKPLQNLELFLNQSSNLTKQLFKIKGLYVYYEAIDKDDIEKVEFNEEKFIEKLESSSIEIKKSFTKDLYTFIQKSKSL